VLRLLLTLSIAAGSLGEATAAGGPAEIYDLEEALHKANRNNGAMQSALQDVKIAEERVREARTLFFPDVGLQGSATRFNARRAFSLRPEFGSNLLFPSNKDNFFSGQAYLSMPLYAGRKNINTYRLAQTALKQARSKYQAAKLDVAYETRKVFYRYLLARDILDSTASLSENASRAKTGRLSGRGALEAATLAADLRNAEAEARRKFEGARLDFLRAVNRELDTPIKLIGALETKPVAVDLAKALVWSTELRPELQAQTYRSQMDAIAVNLALGRRIPTVVLGVDYEVVPPAAKQLGRHGRRSPSVRLELLDAAPPTGGGAAPGRNPPLRTPRSGPSRGAKGLSRP
jgi:outer membrane protein TolC